MLKGAKPKQVFYVPGEHDTSTDDGKQYLERFGKNAKGTRLVQLRSQRRALRGAFECRRCWKAWASWDPHQLEWLAADLKAQPASRPVVVFAHIPLWSVYPDWGWGTEDSEQALGYLKRFGSVTVLNGHIHQVMQKVEGNVTFHTAMSTAFPQPAPGTAKGPGPMKVADDKLKSVLGITDVHVGDEESQPGGGGLQPGFRSLVICHAGSLLFSCLPLALLSQSAPQGKDLFDKRCGGCHALDRDKEGPRLRGVYGRTSGTVASFEYSEAIRKARIVWTEETLEKWLTDPESLVPGNDMAFHVEKAEERRAIIEYLKASGK